MTLKAKTDIPKEIRERVLNRDSYEECPCCIACGHPYPNGKGLHLHHYVSRGAGGRGIEENLVSLCYDCHGRLHNGNSHIKESVKYYLMTKYEDWDENKLKVGGQD